MSTHSHISRYLLILNKLKVGPYAKFEEIQAYIENQYVYMQLQDSGVEIGTSKRTFQRSIKEIRELFNVEIQYDRAEKGYYIENSDFENVNFQRMLEAFDVFNALNLAKDLGPYLHLEKKQPKGTENLYGLLHAIKNKLQIEFSHQKFWEEEITERRAEPYALKEFKNRWYVLAKDQKDNQVKSFGLDRLTNLTLSDIRFKYPADFSIDEMYKYSFGIISPGESEPQNILLSFTPFQGKYIKSLALHHTQEIVKDDEKELRIKLMLCITHDFIMELLSFGADVKVIKPKSLVTELRKAHENAYKRY